MSIHDFLARYDLDHLFLLEKSNETKACYGIDDSECTITNLVDLHNNTKLLFPSYLLRIGALDFEPEMDEATLNVLLESGSAMAYRKLKEIYGENTWDASDEFLVIGAQKGSKSERDILTTKYDKTIKDMITKVDNRYYFKGQSKDDLIQEAFVGLLKSIEVYKIERRTKFKDFSHHVIQRHLGTLMNRSKNYRNRTLNDSVSYNMPVNGQNNDTTFEELLEGSYASPEKIIEDRRTYLEIVGKFTSNEKDVFKHYKKGLTYEEIAYELLKEKGIVNFENLPYQLVSDSLKSYEIYLKAIKQIKDPMTKSLSAKVAALAIGSLEALLEQDAQVDEFIENLQSLIFSKIDSELQTDSSFSWLNSEKVMEDLKNTLKSPAVNNGLLELLVDSGKLSLEKETKIIAAFLEKDIYRALKGYIHVTEEQIADVVLELDKANFKQLTREELVTDIKEKFSFINVDDLTWNDILREMKKKKKSVDNTIQRIRNKGTQHLEEFEEIVKKELVRS